jgi:nucleotide-binding universal stress UspA family protein
VATGASASKTQGQQVDVRPIVAGVDTGGRSMSAVLWAAGEAQSAGRALRLVSAYADQDAGSGRAAKREELAEVARRLTVADLGYDVGIGSPPTVLLDAAAEGALLVVGRRDHSGLRHRLLGSTSTAVVARSPVPVVVVPEQWLQAGPSSAPVVVGVEAPDSDVLTGADEVEHASARDRDRDAVAFAFDRAARLGVPLVVVSAIEVPMIYGWSPEDTAASKQRATEAVTARLHRWRDAHPDVEVDVECVAEIPGRALLEASRVAQLTVLGRHRHGRVGRMTMGGTTRGVLEHAERPIAVVPVTGASSEETR